MAETCSINGLDLSERFYQEIVRPLLKTHFPTMPISAALIGDGSEVLGFDTAMSQDHDWGPRVMIFLHEQDFARFAQQLNTIFQSELPTHFLQLSTQFKTPNQVAESRSNQNEENYPATNHSVELLTIQKFFAGQLNFAVSKEIEPADWLTFSEQKLTSIVSGRVFEDEVGLQQIRDRFAYYPKDVWLYLLACQWTRIEQEGHLMGRAGFVGDELGSRIIAARLVHDLMRLCFLMERQYAPYPKWFGTAFSRLKAGPSLMPALLHSLHSPTWEARQTHLSAAYRIVAELHNELNLTAPMPTSVRPFHDRPFLVISTGEFSQALFDQISTPEIRKIADQRPIGSIDQFSDCTDLVSDPVWRPKLKSLYER